MKTSDLTRIALMLSLLIISAQLSIAIGPIAISLQSLMVLIIGLVLTKEQAFLTSFLYLIAGLIGLPIFAQSMGGPHSIFLPSFGFIISFLPAVWLMAKIREGSSKEERTSYIQAVLLGNFIIYLVGISYMSFILNVYLEMDMTFWQILLAGLLPFIPIDILKSIIAIVIAKRLNTHLLD